MRTGLPSQPPGSVGEAVETNGATDLRDGGTSLVLEVPGPHTLTPEPRPLKICAQPSATNQDVGRGLEIEG
jgi:hypothetical protein